MEQHQLLNSHTAGAGDGGQALCEGFICYSHSWVGPKQSQEKVRGKGWIQYMEQLMSKAAEGGAAQPPAAPFSRESDAFTPVMRVRLEEGKGCWRRCSIVTLTVSEV